MDAPNLGFGLFLILLLIAPQVPLPGLGTDANLPLGAVGLGLWLMLASRLPFRVVLTMPLVLALILFALYAWLVSFNSASLISIAYGAQFAFYAVLGGALIPAYLAHRTRQGRDGEAWRILAWIGGLYLGGIIVSLWTGPIYPHQVGMHIKHYGSIDIMRGVGFAQSTNIAAGVAAVLAAFYLFLYRPGGRISPCFVALGLAGLVATLSRSAILAFLIALGALGFLGLLRAILVRGAVRLRLSLVPTALLALGIIAGIASLQHPTVAAAWQRLALDQEEVGRDIDLRVRSWLSGARSWAANPATEQFGGAGFRSRGVTERGVYQMSHNAYVSMLTDFGLAGVLFFIAILVAAFLRAALHMLTQPDAHLAVFCLVGVTTLAAHNMTEAFFYDVSILTLLVLLLTCGELVRIRQQVPPRNVQAGSLPQSPARPSLAPGGASWSTLTNRAPAARSVPVLSGQGRRD